MSFIQFAELLLLSAIWGGSFMFMRVAAPEFGAITLASLRMLIAALTLLPLFIVFWRKHRKSQLPNFNLSHQQVLTRIALVGLVNSAIPFCLFAFAAITLNAGLSSIINATTPLWGALIGMTLFAVKPTKLMLGGVVCGFIGVVVLSLDKLSFSVTPEMQAILAVISATALYGLAANYSKHYLTGINPILIASGSLLFGAMYMTPLLLLSDTTLSEVSSQAWWFLILLGSLSTGFAYILYYRIINHSGPEKAMMVTYLIPLFGVVFGYALLDESLSINAFYGAFIILFGVGLTTGIIKLKSNRMATKNG